MIKQVALCADSFSLRYPEALGLPGENLKGQEWLEVFSDGEEARTWLTGHPEVRRVWVVGSDDMEAINLAAGLKTDCEPANHGLVEDGFRDDPDRPEDAEGFSREVLLVTGEEGDVPVRARAANLDGVVTPGGFVGLYADEKLRQGQRDRRTAQTATSRRVRPPAARTQEARRVTKRQGVLVPVVSATGGAGKSAIAVLGALAAARAGYRTLLVDADFQFGDAAELLGRSPEAEGAAAHTFDEVLDKTLCADALAKEEGDGPVVLAALSRPERLEECDEAFAGFLSEALGAFDAVVVNTPSRWTELHALLIDHATRVFYVLDQRPSSLSRARTALAMCGRCGMPKKAITGVLNRCRRGALFAAPDAESALGIAVRELAEGGREVEELMALGRAEALFDAYNPMAVGVGDLMAEILPPKEGRARADTAVSGRKTRRRGFPFGRLMGGEACPF